MIAKTSKTTRGGQADRIRKGEKKESEEKISLCRGKKSNLHPGGSEGSKSIHNGHMIRARKTSYRGEEPEQRRAIREEEER